MKKYLALVLCLVMVLSMAACGSSNSAPAESTAPETTAPETTAPETETPEVSDTDYKVAMITDYGDITDESFKIGRAHV